MNRVVHFEIHAKDGDKVQKFYQDVFGWNITTTGPEYGGYRMVMTGEDSPGSMYKGINGGITPRQGDLPMEGAAVNAFVCTIDVENVDQIVEKAKVAGGTVALAAMEVPMVGRLAYLKDPEGTIFGVLQPAPMPAKQ